MPEQRTRVLFVRNEGSLNSSSTSPVRLVDNQNEKGRIRRLHARQAGPLVSLDFSVVSVLLVFVFIVCFGLLFQKLTARPSSRKSISSTSELQCSGNRRKSLRIQFGADRLST